MFIAAPYESKRTMDKHLRQQIDDILRDLDEEQGELTETGGSVKGPVHIYLVDSGSKRPCVLHWPGALIVCLLVVGIALPLSIYPIVTTTTIVVSATVTTQQSTLGPSGVALIMGALALLSISLFARKASKSH